MPIIKASIKDLRKSAKRRQVNKLLKDNLKEAIKNLVKLRKAGKLDEVKANFPKVVSTIDKAAKKNLIHKNNAARKKSNLAKLLTEKK